MENNVYKKRYNVTFSIEIKISKEKLWKLISSPGHLENCHPFCKSNKVINWVEGNYKDELIYLNGLKYIRDFCNFDSGNGYDLFIGEIDGPKSYVVWIIKENSKEKCNLTITVYPYIFARWGRILSYIPFKIYVKPRLKKYLDSVLSGFRYFIETGEPVPKNHKGKHPWFS
tara:strand:- start:271 stop:783 length:513 start_codon:yes stop_codon:yes gene_type:complete